jgi:hypothetical protein
MKVHYFEQDIADNDDFMLKMAIKQGYVPQSCLLGGQPVMGLINEGKDPCNGCTCDRNKCHGRYAKTY